MSYLTYLDAHVFLVVLYTVLFLVKLGFLLYRAEGRLANLRQRTRILEMILPSLFLFTGIMLAWKSGQWDQPWFIAKMTALIMAVVLGIQTFKRNSRALGIMTLLFFIYVFAVSYQKTPTLQNHIRALAETKSEHSFNPASQDYDMAAHGKYLYYTLGCPSCHGDAGDKGYAGAPYLRTSNVGDVTAKNTIIKGSRNMPGYGNYLNGRELEALAGYVKSLRQ